MKMTAAEYLKARGWIGPATVRDGLESDAPLVEVWVDPLIGENDGLDTEAAVTLQLARDAIEERAAWVRFAASAMQTEQALYNTDTAADRADRRHSIDVPGGANGDSFATAFEPDRAADHADAMLERYCSRFAPAFNDKAAS